MRERDKAEGRKEGRKAPRGEKNPVCFDLLTSWRRDEIIPALFLLQYNAFCFFVLFFVLVLCLYLGKCEEKAVDDFVTLLY